MPATNAQQANGQDRGWWRPSIKTYLILMNFILLCLLFPSVTMIFLNEEARFRDTQLARTITQMRKDLESQGGSLIRSLALSAGQAIAGYDFTFMNIMVGQVVSNNPEIVYCIIMDANRLTVAHNNPKMVGSILDSAFDREVAAMLAKEFPGSLPAGQSENLVRFLDFIMPREERTPRSILEVVAPIYSGARLWGVIRCGYSLEKLEKEIKVVQEEWQAKITQLEIYFVSMAGIFFSVGVVVAALFTRTFVRSVRVLQEGVGRVSEGDLEHMIEQRGLVCDEFMRLSKDFNEMTVKLRDSREQLSDYSRSLELKVEERTRDLRVAQRRLVEQAHEAGMAEMAVGILHNIGNAITPAKVGAALLIRRLKGSPFYNSLQDIIGQTRKAVQATIVLPEPDKERLIKILDLLPGGIKEEYDGIVEELHRILSKHEHIEAIIVLQMRYARLAGDPEEVDVNRILEDALDMLKESIEKRAVQVTSSFAALPLVRIEQAKLLQILVNLIKNAYEAMDEIRPEDRQLILTTSLEPGPPADVMISIRDTGVGFMPEDHKRFFTFGFSTKTKGSGFGLHSCANYLRANHGSLSAYSEGLGKGGEFVVRLAVSPGGGCNTKK